MKLSSRIDYIILAAIAIMTIIVSIFYFFPVPKVVNRKLTKNLTVLKRCLTSGGIQYQVTSSDSDALANFYDASGNFICSNGLHASGQNYCLDVKLCLPVQYDQEQSTYESRSVERTFPGFGAAWDKFFDNPRFITITSLNIDWESTDYVERSYQFLNEYKNIFKMKNPEAELKLVSQYSDSKIGMTVVALHQYVGDVPVVGGELIFHFKKDGSLSSENGTYVPDISTMNTMPTITQEQAFEVAKKDFPNDDVAFTKEQLVIYDYAVFEKQPSDAHLAWQFHTISSNIFSSYTYYIDAQTGEFLKRVSNTIID